MKVVVIGSGTMGNGIAHTFALFGNQVSLVDTSAEALTKAIIIITQNLNRQLAKGSISETQKTTTLNNIKTFSGLKSALPGADLVVEAVTENIDIKLQIFKILDEYCDPATVLASNTSSISITTIAAATNRPDKVIGMHFMNPVPLMTLVEVVRGKATSDTTTQLVVKTALELDKIPVEVNDAPGFVANRIVMPMINEAIYALHEGLSGVAEIDAIMRLGMAHPKGPLQLADYIGLDVCLAILNVMKEGFDNIKYAPCPLLVEMVAKGETGIKSGLGFYDYSNSDKNNLTARRFN